MKIRWGERETDTDFNKKLQSFKSHISNFANITERNKQTINPDNTVVTLQSQLSHFVLLCCFWPQQSYFFHIVQCRCMYCVCAEHSNDNRDISLFSEQTLSLSRVKAFSVCWAATLIRKLRVHEKMEETQSGQVATTNQRVLPDYMTSCLVYKLGRRRRKGRTFEVMTFDFPSHF